MKIDFWPWWYLLTIILNQETYPKGVELDEEISNGVQQSLTPRSALHIAKSEVLPSFKALSFTRWSNCPHLLLTIGMSRSVKETDHFNAQCLVTMIHRVASGTAESFSSPAYNVQGRKIKLENSIDGCKVLIKPIVRLGRCIRQRPNKSSVRRFASYGEENQSQTAFQKRLCETSQYLLQNKPRYSSLYLQKAIGFG